MKNLLIISLFLFPTASISAQQVISSAGSTKENISWTIGEVVTETTIGDFCVLQGFNQSDDLGPVSIEPVKSAIEFNIYPNPVTDKLIIECQNNESYIWKLTNLIGQEIAHSQPFASNTTVDMTVYTPGNYLLTVLSDREIKTITIIKK